MVALVDTAKTQSELALAVGVTRRTIIDWCKEPDFPRNEDGTYNIDAVQRWRESRAAEKAPDDLRERRLLAECIKLELANEETRGELVRRADVQNEAAEMFAAFKAILDGLADAIAKDLPDEHRVTGQQTAQHHVDLSLRKMAAWKAKLDDSGAVPDSP